MSNDPGKNLLFAGVGGQGTLLVSELTARAALHAGFDVKKTEVHGAAQRGGSVVSHVRYASRVFSPLIPAGEVDILLSLEKLEGLRWAHYVRENGIILLNDEERMPQSMSEKKVDYPQKIEEFLEKKEFALQTIDATSVAIECGNYRAANVVLLGAMSAHSRIADEHWIAVLKESLAPHIVDVNLRAFERGKQRVDSFGMKIM